VEVFKEDQMNTSHTSVDCYVALELSQSKWLVGALLPAAKKVITVSVTGGDIEGLIIALNEFEARALSNCAPDQTVKLRVCFEAGYDGFWLARFLLDQGIDTTVLDASSFLVSRRGKRAKTDRIDVEAMALTLKAYLLGDLTVCRPVRLPSPAEEDAKRLSRERTQLKKERTRHVNRIRALLMLNGIRKVRGLFGRCWEQWLEAVQTGDGRPLGTFIKREIRR
jgi:transposase